MFDLRAWLRRAPKPRKLRIHVDGDERIIDLGTGRCKWVEVEETVRNAGATLVECLSADLSIIRSTVLEEDPDDKEDVATATSTAMAKAQAGSAAMLDAYGKRMNEAFLAGASAANTSQENLVAIVETLTAHLSLAITNLHNLSTNMATMAQNYADALNSGGGDGEGKSDKMLGLLTAMLTAKAGLPAAPAPANGKGKAT